MRKEELELYLVKKSCTTVEAMQKIDRNGKGILFVVDDSNKLEGVITDGDVRRWLIKTGNLQSNIGIFMNKHPYMFSGNEIEVTLEEMNEKRITALPVVDEQGIIINVIFRGFSNEPIRKPIEELKEVPVIIMAGGKGTRLYPYTKILPKPLIPIKDIPIMERIMDRFRVFGIKSFYVTVNYRKNMIKSYFSELKKDYEICFIDEDIPLGTAGSLKLCPDEFASPIIVTNCDILIDANYSDIYRHHMQSGNEITIVSALKNITVPYGVIHSSENGLVKNIQEKPKLSYFINSGMYILNEDLINDIPHMTFFHMTDLIDMLLKKGRKVGIYPISEDSFLDMGEFEEMHRMERKLSLKTD